MDIFLYIIKILIELIIVYLTKFLSYVMEEFYLHYHVSMMTFSSSALFQLANEVSAFLFFQQLQIKKVQLWNTKDSTRLMNELSFNCSIKWKFNLIFTNIYFLLFFTWHVSLLVKYYFIHCVEIINILISILVFHQITNCHFCQNFSYK